MPVYGADVLSSGCFQMVGKLLAHSILHGGEGLVVLAPPITNYLVFGSIEEAGKLVTPQDLPDVDLQMLLEEKVNFIWTVFHAITVSSLGGITCLPPTSFSSLQRCNATWSICKM